MVDSELLGLEDKITDLATKALNAKNTDGIWGTILRMVVGLAVAVGVWFLVRTVSQRTRELAEAKAELEKSKAQAEFEAKTAEVKAIQNNADFLVTVAEERVEAVKEKLRKVEELEAAYQQKLKDIDAISSWEDLERLAGGSK